MKKKPITLLIHIAFGIILLGALTTHFWGSQGTIHLRLGEEPTAVYLSEEKQPISLPFAIALKDFEIDYYDGTYAEMDYISTVETSDGTLATIRMNKIFSHHGYRFYQSSYDSDRRGSLFSVTHDPWGIGITYTGYSLLFISLMVFFFQRRTYFRSLCRQLSNSRGLRIA